MPRTFCWLVAIVVIALPCRADEIISGSETLIRLRVSPAPAPKPALKYQLLPELAEMNPGNPVQGYMKCFMEQQKFFFDKAAFDRREKLLAMPLKELQGQDMLEYGGFPLTQADWAARLDTPDWQVLLKIKSDSFALLVPELQEIRLLANPLKVRFRSEVASGRFDRAMHTAKTMFAMARHLGEHPTLIGTLVGLSMANSAIGPLEELIEQPGSPNLYWALTALPAPLVSVEMGAQSERLWPTIELWDLDEARPMTAERLSRFLIRLEKALGNGTAPTNGQVIRTAVEQRIKATGMLEAARRRLVEDGASAESLKSFPPDQIILLDEKHEAEVRRDDILKLMSLPPWQAAKLVSQTKPWAEPRLFAHRFVEGLLGVYWRQSATQQRIALLRHVEALRLHAAEHHGALPAKLSEISVPLPDDLFTGKPFEYELNGATAHIRGAAAPRKNGDGPASAIHYEVTLQH